MYVVNRTLLRAIERNFREAGLMAGKAKSRGEVSDDLDEQLTNEVDTATVDAGLSKRDAAQVYRELAGSFRERESMLDAEADQAGE